MRRVAITVSRHWFHWFIDLLVTIKSEYSLVFLSLCHFEPDSSKPNLLLFYLLFYISNSGFAETRPIKFGRQSSLCFMVAANNVGTCMSHLIGIVLPNPKPETWWGKKVHHGLSPSCGSILEHWKIYPIKWSSATVCSGIIDKKLKETGIQLDLVHKLSSLILDWALKKWAPSKYDFLVVLGSISLFKWITPFLSITNV